MKAISNQLWKTGSVKQHGKFIMPWLGDGDSAEFKRPSAGALFQWLLTRNQPAFPTPDMFEVKKPKFNAFEEDARCTWLGHSTCLLQVRGVNILTDAVFSDRCSPFQWAGPLRYVPPACTIADLPPIHLVLTSHDHYDHLDYQSAVELEQRFQPVFACGLELGQWFQDYASVAKERVIEMDWWEKRTLFDGKIDVEFVPVQHWSKRQAIGDDCRTLWGGFTIKAGSFKFFFNGDTGYHKDLYQEIGQRCGPFDFCAIPIGAYEPRNIMQLQHIDPAEAFIIHQDLGSKYSFGIHHATFILTDEPVKEPAEKIKAISEANPGVPPFVAVQHGASMKMDTSTGVMKLEE